MTRRAGTVAPQAVLDGGDAAVCIVDPQGCCTFVSRSAASLLGYPPGDMIGADLHTLVHRGCDGSSSPCKDSECVLRSALRGRFELNLPDDQELTRADGSLLVAACRLSPLVTEGPFTGAVVTLVDMGERRRMERRLAMLNRISLLLVGVTDFRTVAPEVLGAIGECFGWSVMLMWLLESGTSQLRLATLWRSHRIEATTSLLVDGVIASGTGLAAELARGARSDGIVDLAGVDDLSGARAALEAGFRGALAFPIRKGSTSTEWSSASARHPSHPNRTCSPP